MYMFVFKCTSIILFIFTILINFTIEIDTHVSICVSFLLLLNYQNGLVFVTFNLKFLLGCYPSHFHIFSLILLSFV